MLTIMMTRAQEGSEGLIIVAVDFHGQMINSSYTSVADMSNTLQSFMISLSNFTATAATGDLIGHQVYIADDACFGNPYCFKICADEEALPSSFEIASAVLRDVNFAIVCGLAARSLEVCSVDDDVWIDLCSLTLCWDVK